MVSFSSDDLASLEGSHRAVRDKYGRHAFRGTPTVCHVFTGLSFTEYRDYTELISYSLTLAINTVIYQSKQVLNLSQELIILGIIDILYIVCKQIHVHTCRQSGLSAQHPVLQS